MVCGVAGSWYAFVLCVVGCVLNVVCLGCGVVGLWCYWVAGDAGVAGLWGCICLFTSHFTVSDVRAKEFPDNQTRNQHRSNPFGVSKFLSVSSVTKSSAWESCWDAILTPVDRFRFPFWCPLDCDGVP